MALKDYERPSVTVDMVIFSVIEDDLKVLLIKRGREPFKDKWAIPGGFVKMEESVEDAAIRELKEETGITTEYLEQLYTFGEVKRDPRGRVISIAYFALVGKEVSGLKLRATTDAKEARWYSIGKLPKLAFDHQEILNYAVKRVKWKFEYTTVAFSMLSHKFTLSDVQNLYEIVFNKKFDKRNFRKKILSLDILKEEEIMTNVSYRPPQLYSLKKDIGEIIEIL